MHSIVKSLFMLIAALLLCLNVRQAYADTPYDTMGMVFANADAGWETMILHGNDYEKYHHGFSTTLSAGINVFCFLGLQIEQDLGFIELQRAEGSPKKELLFKGATLSHGHYFLQHLVTSHPVFQILWFTSSWVWVLCICRRPKG